MGNRIIQCEDYFTKDAKIHSRNEFISIITSFIDNAKVEEYIEIKGADAIEVKISITDKLEEYALPNLLLLQAATCSLIATAASKMKHNTYYNCSELTYITLIIHDILNTFPIIGSLVTYNTDNDILSITYHVRLNDGRNISISFMVKDI